MEISGTLTSASTNAKHTIAMITRWASPSDRILDIGCGSAEIAHFLERLGYNYVTNVDIVDIRQFDVQNFALFDGSNLPFRNSEFDLVSLNFVLHHIPNYKKSLLLVEAERVSKRYLFVLEDTPRNTFDWILSYLHGLRMQATYGGQDFGFYSQAKWIELFRSLDLDVVVCETISRFARKLRQPYSRSLFLLMK